MYVDLPIRGTDECRSLLKNVTDLLPGMFCAGYLEGGRDACQVIFLFIYVYICMFRNEYDLYKLLFFESFREILEAEWSAMVF